VQVRDWNGRLEPDLHGSPAVLVRGLAHGKPVLIKRISLKQLGDDWVFYPNSLPSPNTPWVDIFLHLPGHPLIAWNNPHANLSVTTGDAQELPKMATSPAQLKVGTVWVGADELYVGCQMGDVVPPGYGEPNCTGISSPPSPMPPATLSTPTVPTTPSPPPAPAQGSNDGN